jgi:hypothetical protein
MKTSTITVMAILFVATLTLHSQPVMYGQSRTALSNGWALASEITQDWTSGAWTNALQTFYTHDKNGYLASSFEQIWDNNAWVNSQSLQYTY